MTLVVLLILAGITISLLLGDTGIFEKAQQSEDEYKIGELKDRISTVILDWETEKRIPNTTGDETIGTLEDLWSKFVDADIIDNAEEDIYNQEGTDIYEVTTNEGYVIEIIVKEDGTVEIGDIIKVDGLPPEIGEVISRSTSNSIHVEVNITRSTGEVSLSYYYKKDGELEGSYIPLKENVADLTADFTGLEQNAIYDIKVVVTDDNGSTEKVISEITGKLAEGTISQVGETQWNDGTATIQLETTETAEEIYIVYQIGGIDGEWLPYPEEGISGLNHGDMIYAAISDGTNVSKESSFEIEDGIAPTVTLTQGTITTKSIEINVVAVDEQWGMEATPTYNYYIKESTAGSYPTEASYTGTDTSYTFDNLSQTTSYDIKVTVADKAGNEGSKETKGITTGTVGGATGDLTSGNIISSSPTWNNNTASITLSKGADVASNLSIQWQKNSISGTWTTGTSVTGLNHNDIVYARLTDGVNYGQEASVTITDTIAPTISSFTSTSKSYTSITVRVTASDAQSGLASSGTYQYYLGSTLKSTSTSTTYTYSGLSAGTQYTLKVIVKDKAGKTATRSINVTTNSYPSVTTLKEGNYVNYVDKNGTTRKCMVLYDNTSGYGIQIITMSTIGSVTLGDVDESDDQVASADSYNNAITTLNNAATNYLNTTYATSARNVGSVPNNKNSESTTYTTYNNQYNGLTYRFRGQDSNYVTDWNQMGTLGIRSTGTNYWLSSRAETKDTNIMLYDIRHVNTSGAITTDEMLYVFVETGNLYPDTCTYAIRPVFTLKTTLKITGGSGTSSTPYTLGV